MTRRGRKSLFRGRGRLSSRTSSLRHPTRSGWLGGLGTILVGNGRNGLSSVGFAGDTLLSITRFKDQYVIASDYALHIFDGHLLKSLKPHLRGGSTPTPLRVQAIYDVLYYFDYKLRIYRFDGERWDQIPIPPELLKRDFKGLPKRNG